MAKITARSVMTDSVVSVSPESSLLDLLRLFVEEEIHGPPVVDDGGPFVGVISSSDLLRAQADEQNTASIETDYLRGILEFSMPDWTADLTDFQNQLAQRTVAEVMTKTFASVPHDAPVAEVARGLRENQIHRIWVGDEGRVCGVVSALDLMPVIERGNDTG